MRVLAGNIKEGDIIHIQTPDNFRGQAGRPTLAYVYAVNYTPAGRDPSTGGELVESLSVMQVMEENRIPSGTKAHTLPPQAAEAAKLDSTGFKSWGIIFDPVVIVAMDDKKTLGTNSEYYVDRIGSLPPDAVEGVTLDIRDAVGEENLRFSDRDGRYHATDYTRIFGPSVNESRLEPKAPSDTPARQYRRKKPVESKRHGRHGPASGTTTADIPLAFAQSALGLNSIIVEMLTAAKINTLYEARMAAETPDKLHKIFEKHSKSAATDARSSTTELSDEDITDLIEQYRQSPDETDSQILKRFTEVLETSKPAAIRREIMATWGTFMEEFLKIPDNGPTPEKFQDAQGQSVIVRTPVIS